MSTSAQRAPDPWDQRRRDLEFDVLAQDPPPPPYVPQQPHVPPDAAAEPASEDDTFDHADEPADRAHVDTGYSSVGVPGRGIALLTATAVSTVAGLDFALTGELSFFFDLCFVVVCLVAAMGVAPYDLFTVGVLPPLAFGGLIGAIAVLSPGTFVAAASLSETFLTGLSAHAGALVAGYGIALVAVGLRAMAARRF